MDPEQKARRLAQEIEGLALSEGIDYLDAADRIMEGSDEYNPFDYYYATTAVGQRQSAEKAAWGGRALEEDVRALAAREGISEEEAYDRLPSPYPPKIRTRMLTESVNSTKADAEGRAKVKALAEKEGITEAEAEIRLYDRGVIGW